MYSLSRNLLSRIVLLSLLLCQGAWSDDAMHDSHSATGPKPKTVVLVHGYFADGSSWREVIRILQAAGVNVVSVQNPLASLAGDVEATRRVIDQQSGEVVLVGHSWGGMVITQAGVNPKVTSLVYVAAFAPSVGDSVNSLQASLPAPDWLADLLQDDSGDLRLSQEGILKYFAPDVPTRQAKVIAATQGAFFFGTLNETVSEAAWLTKPSWYIQAEDDKIIDPVLEKAMGSKIHAKLLSVHSSHVVMVSHPDAVATVILEAALGRKSE